MSQIPKIVLDPDDDESLLAQMYTRVYNASEGHINDFREGSVVTALFEGMAYAQGTLLWYLNQLPEALAIEAMRYSTGITRTDGTPAKGVLHFQLGETLGTNFLIDTSYTIPYLDGYFTLDAPLIIPSGAYEATANVTFNKVGSQYNAAPWSIVITNTGLSGLSTIYNDTPMSGGSDLEPLEQTLNRMQRALRQRYTLVTAEHYQDRAVELLGGGRALAIPLLTSDLLTESPGNVHLFLLGNDGDLPNDATLATIRETLTSEGFAASYAWASPVEFYKLSLDIVITVLGVSQNLADSVWEAILDLYNPLTYPFGQSVSLQDLVVSLRGVDGVTQVFSSLINGSSLDLALSKR